MKSLRTAVAGGMSLEEKKPSPAAVVEIAEPSPSATLEEQKEGSFLVAQAKEDQ